MKNRTKLNQKIKRKFKSYTQKEAGVTLVALIVTIVIMVIISAVSIMAVYNSRIVEHAINGTQDYAGEGINENKVLEGTEKLIESVVDNLKKIGGGSEPEISKPEESTPPEPKELAAEELAQEEMIGRYVDYKPQGTDYTVDGTYSGTGTSQTFAKNDDMKWRIWGVENNKLLLISETLAGKIKLANVNGYNNAVKILNDACSTAFGNSSYGEAIKVRSINQDDIDKVTNMTTDAQRKAVTPKYGTPTTPNDTNWPNIYAQEPGKTGGGTLERSAQDKWYTGMTNSTFTGKHTEYSYLVIYKTNIMHSALLTNMRASSTSGTTSHTTYWIASRCVDINNQAADFKMFIMANGQVSSNYFYYSSGGTNSPSNAVRPIVEINLDGISIRATGSGTNTEPYSMALK